VESGQDGSVKARDEAGNGIFILSLCFVCSGVNCRSRHKRDSFIGTEVDVL
jgi:hypothetical protein